ncbi:TPA: SDR family NAD(P)-dependent oxidoreductase [Enterococcus faecium]
MQSDTPQKKIKLLPLDLTQEDNYAIFNRELEANRPNIKLLVNNAGLVASNSFSKISLERQESMIRLNALTPVILTHMTLPFMEKGSQIINICSVAGFAPTPNMLTYSSTKAFLYNFSKGLHAELREKGINVLAMSPGNMKTELFSSPDMPKGKSIVNLLPFLDMKKISRRALQLSAKGKMEYTPHFVYKSYHVLAKLLPSKVIMMFSKV